MTREPIVATPQSSHSGTVIRTVAGLIPVALPVLVGLAHGALGSGTGNGKPAAPTAAVSQQGATGIVPAGPLAEIHCGGGTAELPLCTVPYPMLTKGHPVEWFFVFKLNASLFPKCGDGVDTRTCTFDSGLQPADYKQGFGQRYAVASSEAPGLVDGGPQCAGTTTSDPVGATFDEVYNGGYHYVIWNDQFHDVGPAVLNCSKGDCGAPWGHSKGLIAWNDAGEGFVMQVSTPSWPGSGTPSIRRKIGNTLGCIVGDDDVGVSQHFFALHLTRSDLVEVLTGLNEASVATDPTNRQVASGTDGSPPEIAKLVSTLGVRSNQAGLDGNLPFTLSSGVQFIAKPSNLHVPPWQMVSAALGGVPLRTATWWATPYISSTTAQTPVPCWDAALSQGLVHGKPEAVDIAARGTWGTPAKSFSLKSDVGTNGNHAKVGVSTTATDHYVIFGDENQQGTLGGPGEDCGSSQNGRGGMFFVMKNQALSTSLGQLLEVGTPGGDCSSPWWSKVSLNNEFGGEKHMPKTVTITQETNRYFATVDNGPSFEVGRRVTYAAPGGSTIGLSGSLGATAKYNPADFASEYGLWAYFIAPTALCESNGQFATLNSYDSASFTWSFLQFGAHVPNGDFVLFFRKLLAHPEATDYFPDLKVAGGRICCVGTGGTVVLESDASTQLLMKYLNPSVQAVEDAEVINAAKLVHWTTNSATARLLQVDTGVSLFRANMRAYAQRYALDGIPDFVCLVIADIRHQGRGTSVDILQAMDTGGDNKKAYENLIEVGSHLYAGRCQTLDKAIQAYIEAGNLGTSTYSCAQSDFIAN